MFFPCSYGFPMVFLWWPEGNIQPAAEKPWRRLGCPPNLWLRASPSNFNMKPAVVPSLKYWLVVLTCFNHLEKYESQWEGWNPIYDKENKKCSKPPIRICVNRTMVAGAEKTWKHMKTSEKYMHFEVQHVWWFFQLGFFSLKWWKNSSRHLDPFWHTANSRHFCVVSHELPKLGYPLVNVNKKRWKDPPCY